MKKSTFVSSLLGVVGGAVSATGMVLALVESFNLLIPGIIVGSVGLLILLLIYPIHRLMEGQGAPSLRWPLIGTIAYGVVSSLVLGFGMCLYLVYGQTIAGIAVGAVGILLLLGLIPFIMKLQGKKIEITFAKILSLTVGVFGFALVGVGTYLCLNGLEGTNAVIGLVLGIVGILACAVNPIVYKYAQGEKI